MVLTINDSYDHGLIRTMVPKTIWTMISGHGHGPDETMVIGPDQLYHGFWDQGPTLVFMTEIPDTSQKSDFLFEKNYPNLFFI